MYKRFVCAGLCAALIFGGLAGCQLQDKITGMQSHKTVVTMLYSSKLSEFETLVESTYPDIDLQCERTVTATMIGELARRLRNDQGPDLIVTYQSANPDIIKYELDLSAELFSEKYDNTMLASTNQNGKTFCLPLPGQYYGYTINVTLLKQAGEEIPTTEQELIDTLTRMKQAGIGTGEDGAVFGIQMIDSMVLGRYLVGHMIPDFLGTMEGESWAVAFREKRETLSGKWMGCFSTLEMLGASGAFNTKMASFQNNSLPVSQRLGSGQLAAAYGGSELICSVQKYNRDSVNQGTAEPYEYQMLPFLSSQGNAPWALSSPVGYIGINSKLETEENAVKREACARVLGLLSTKEGQQAFADDALLSLSYLRDCTIRPAASTIGLDDCISAGYVYDIRMPSKIVEYLGSTAFRKLAGEITTEDVLEKVNDYYYNGSEAVDYDLSVVGTVASDLPYLHYNTRREETTLGNLIADSVAELSGAPVAVVNGGGIRASLYAGDVRGSDLQAVCPYDNTIVVLEMTGQTLWNMIQNGLTQIRKDDVPGGRFLQVSGIKYEYEPGTPLDDVEAIPCTLRNVVLADGTPLDFKASYQVAVNDYMAGSKGYLDGAGDGYKMLNVYSDTAPRAEGVTLVKETGSTYRDALKAYFFKHKNEKIDPALEGRITVRSK